MSFFFQIEKKMAARNNHPGWREKKLTFLIIEVPAWFFYVDYFHFYLYHLLKIEEKKKNFWWCMF